MPTIAPLLLGSLLIAQAAGTDELPRAAYFGMRFAPLTDDARAKHSLGADSPGVLVDGVLPESIADDIGLKAGDVILELDGKPLSRPVQVVEFVATHRAGSAAEIKWSHDGKVTAKTITLKGRPREKSEAYDIVYGSVTSNGHRLRTIITRPKGEDEKKHPALLVIQGLGMFTMDNSMIDLGYSQIVDDFTKRGFVTMRVDKPGVGDSEGGPASQVDFNRELDAFRQALVALKMRPDVDPERVLVFGHSMGGVFAPLIAKSVPVRGIAVYGTVSRGWFEYILENARRQGYLSGAEPAQVDSDVRALEKAQHALLVDKLTPKQIAEKYPDLPELARQQSAEGDQLFGRHFSFFQQLADQDLGAAWQAVDAHVLALWGKSDFVSSGDDHARIAWIVNRSQDGKGVYRALDGIDHGFRAAASPEESIGRRITEGEFNPLIVETLRSWSDKCVK